MPRSWIPALAGATLAAVLTPAFAPAQDCAGSAFWAAESLEARDSPRKTVIADFNGDGLADLAVSQFQTNSVQVSLRQAGESFTTQVYGTAQGVGLHTDVLVYPPRQGGVLPARRPGGRRHRRRLRRRPRRRQQLRPHVQRAQEQRRG